MTSVLIADDNADFAALVSECLAEHGVEPRVVCPAKLMLTPSAWSGFDVAVIDVDHCDPGLASESAGSFLLVTARDTPPVCQGSHVSDWIRKPCSLKELSSKVLLLAKVSQAPRLP
jgi:DNA-binding response OmpR family regulator